MRGLYRLPDENKSVLKIESANLETEANFTCMAYNSAGDGDSATTFVDVQGEKISSLELFSIKKKWFLIEIKKKSSLEKLFANLPFD